MAAAVAEYSDTAVITSDNPRSEDPDDILDQVQRGFPKGFDFIREKDREKAIGMALRLAVAGDTLILAGKGHEREQVYRDRTEYFCEEEIVRRYFENQS
jgi:UDP-N-acetylmuramoyl-L-alanyl-D-glutamate--2,6-diaminopimelate ligase